MRKALQILILLAVCCAGSGWAQENSDNTKNQCENYGKEKFIGELISFNINEKTDIRDFLKIFAEKFSCQFVVDKSLGQIPVTVKVENVPWNILLDAILRSQKLGIQKNGSIFRVAKLETLEEVKRINLPVCGLKDSSLLVTEEIKLINFTPQTMLSSNSSLLQIINRRVSAKGFVEVDEKSNTLKITDKEENIKAIKDLLKILDQPNWKELLEKK